MSTLYIIVGLGVYCLAYENIALNKPAFQHYPYPYADKMGGEHLIQAGNAVDGLRSNLSVWAGQCVISDIGKQNATLWVNLGSIFSIHHITIYYRTGNAPWGRNNGFTSRFLGFSLYVSNTTNKSDGTLCFEDTNFNLDTIPAVFNTTCFLHEQYVIYYNERLAWKTYPVGYSEYAFNELCELEVFGCLRGYYGFTCNIPCSEHCLSDCHIETGNCQGCKPGYRGDRCELKCEIGKHGYQCQSTCGFCLVASQCSHVDGTCLTGCSAGYIGSLCKTKCEIGKYGNQCQSTCGACLDPNKCSHVDGTCLTGCASGYTGSLCKTKCNKNKYGLNCSETCGNCHDLSECHYINGSCLNGCGPGFLGEKCNLECSPGFYGVECLQECSSFCKRSRDCNHVTGFCKNGCKTGWQGSDCFEGSQLDTISDWKLRFYGMLGAFCVLVISIGLLVAYIIIITRRQKKRNASQYKQDKPTKQTESQYCEAHATETADGGYQELGEINTISATYQNLETR
uniref:Platelet endothelial aggregation receptor 1-like isoform X2 n=1 Tax=Crassostrea virginica TaxID=6565 RepID=A0A8B8BZM9_CRAVI|nr:platelet endothelial aggregation receptor 1-like isoform X2 [Crassostrea virginica]